METLETVRFRIRLVDHAPLPLSIAHHFSGKEMSSLQTSTSSTTSSFECVTPSSPPTRCGSTPPHAEEVTSSEKVTEGKE